MNHYTQSVTRESGHHNIPLHKQPTTTPTIHNRPAAPDVPWTLPPWIKVGGLTAVNTEEIHRLDPQTQVAARRELRDPEEVRVQHLEEEHQLSNFTPMQTLGHYMPLWSDFTTKTLKTLALPTQFRGRSHARSRSPRTRNPDLHSAQKRDIVPAAARHQPALGCIISPQVFYQPPPPVQGAWQGIPAPQQPEAFFAPTPQGNHQRS